MLAAMICFFRDLTSLRNSLMSSSEDRAESWANAALPLRKKTPARAAVASKCLVFIDSPGREQRPSDERSRRAGNLLGQLVTNKNAVRSILVGDTNSWTPSSRFSPQLRLLPAGVIDILQPAMGLQVRAFRFSSKWGAPGNP